MKRITILVVLLHCKLNALQLPFPQDTIAYNDRFNNRQSIAFDSQGRIHVSYTGQVGTNSATQEIYYVTDSAGHFTTRQVTNNLVSENYSTISVDGNDRVHIGFLGRDAGNLYQVQYTRLVNGTFTTPVFITQGGLNKATPYSVIGPDSVMHFVYFTFTTDADNAYYRSYNLRDSILSPERFLVGAEVTGDLDASVATDSAGFVHIVVKAGAITGGPLKYYTNRTGTLVETPTGISADVDYPRVSVDRNTVVHILYRDSPSEILYVINNAQGAFGVPVAVSRPGQRPAVYTNFAIDGSNRLFVGYQSSVTTSGRGFFLVHGRNGVFSDTIKVWDLITGYVTRNTSAVAARGNGEVAVLYAPGGSRNSNTICDIFMQRGTVQTNSVGSETEIPSTITLSQNYPNPFNPSTTIGYHLTAASFVRLKVYDLLGREVATLVEQTMPPGTHVSAWDASSQMSGVYVYRLTSRGFSQTKRMILLK